MREPPDKIEGGYVYRGMIDRGTKYKDAATGEIKDFTGEDGRKYIGLLNGRGEPLQLGEPLHILWFEVRKADERDLSK
ncbi:hypothetical protein VN12_02150 [Pirellula sp. SH-Sr6A]|nr:hypothetical protein VN12_02150 [Pirellula sp. SH-Sr6A]